VVRRSSPAAWGATAVAILVGLGGASGHPLSPAGALSSGRPERHPTHGARFLPRPLPFPIQVPSSPRRVPDLRRMMLFSVVSGAVPGRAEPPARCRRRRVGLGVSASSRAEPSRAAKKDKELWVATSTVDTLTVALEAGVDTFVFTDDAVGRATQQRLGERSGRRPKVGPTEPGMPETPGLADDATPRLSPPPSRQSPSAPSAHFSAALPPVHSSGMRRSMASSSSSAAPTTS